MNVRIYKKPYRVKKRKSIIKNRFFWAIILLFLVFSGTFYFLFLSSFFQIKKVEISGNQKIALNQIESLIEEKAGRKIMTFSSKSIFLADFNKIKKEFLNKFPQAEKINLKRKLPDTLVVKIIERKEAAILDFPEKSFFIDKEGIVFEEVPKEIEGYLRISETSLNQTPGLGEQALKKELMDSILEINLRLRDDFKIPPKEIVIVSEDRLNVRTSEGWEIYFDPKKDTGWQMQKLAAVLEKVVPAEKRNDLEYIELRFGRFRPPKIQDGWRG